MINLLAILDLYSMDSPPEDSAHMTSAHLESPLEDSAHLESPLEDSAHLESPLEDSAHLEPAHLEFLMIRTPTLLNWTPLVWTLIMTLSIPLISVLDS